MSDHLLLWEGPDWQARARAWVRSALDQNDLQLTGVIEQPHIRPWSTVMTVPTERGLYFFKASASAFAHETALTAYLSRFRPELFPNLLAVDMDQHWMLMRDAGRPIRHTIREERTIEPWREVMPHYVNLQKDLSSRVDELLSLGVMDRRLHKLPALFEGLIADEASMLLGTDEDSLSTEEYRRLKQSVPEFERMCRELADFGIPETIHHDDFHDANIFKRDGKLTFTDWGESAVTHPFFTLVVMMRSVDNSFGVDYSPEAGLVRDMYLEHWSSYGSLDDLRAIVKLAQRIGYVNRALTWKMVIEELPEALKSEYAIAVPSYLKDFIDEAN
jgi:hypothetical protein